MAKLFSEQKTIMTHEIGLRVLGWVGRVRAKLSTDVHSVINGRLLLRGSSVALLLGTRGCGWLKGSERGVVRMPGLLWIK